MMELLFTRENMLSALHRVETNKGSHGVDGMSVKDLRDHIKQNWLTIRESIENGSYEPSSVRRVEIPKPNGGTGLLGIPTVLDRFIQQAITQILTPLFDPEFSEHSYGFRPNRRGHEAVRKARRFMQEGYRIVVDFDLEKFLDRVHHDRLMARLAEKVTDKTLLKLIHKYLQSGVTSFWMNWIKNWRSANCDSSAMRTIVRHECMACKKSQSNAEQEMKVGPSEPLYRRRLQTTLSCCGQKPWW